MIRKRTERKTIADKDDSKMGEKFFPIVAIGCSAGGLDAASELLRSLPDKPGMAFIYVQHLSPDHKSLLSPILSKVTSMKVQEIGNMEEILVNHVYVIPNNKSIEVTDGHIRLLPRTSKRIAVSVDTLFESLALTHKEHVMGVILSGNGSDGRAGLAAIKKAGGITFAQDNSAQVPSMPHASIDAGIVDFVLSPKKIAAKLLRFTESGIPARFKKSIHPEFTIPEGDPHLHEIVEMLRQEIKVDFSRYKSATVRRRIAHRMRQTDVQSVRKYLKFLRNNKLEIISLYKDLLINVTSFFRDPESFTYLKSTILPDLLKAKKPGSSLRLWVAACSTGEEAYTLAMLISELQARKKNKINVQIFATDLSEQAINHARIGEYSKESLEGVGKRRLSRFFTKTGDHYRIVKSLREMCVFAPHNILRDPPFSRIDFISCRNLLIYFDPAAQKKALAVIGFALNDGGFLMLGKSESVGSSTSIFHSLNKRHKIYSRKANMGVRKALELLPHQRRGGVVAEPAKTPARKNSLMAAPELDSIINTTLLKHYMPSCVIINKEMDILKFRGQTSTFLSHSSGNATLNILKMAKPEFAFELRNAINEVIKSKKVVVKSGLELKGEKNDQFRQLVSFEVRPISEQHDEPVFLVVFTIQHERYVNVDGVAGGGKDRKQKDNRLSQHITELQKAGAEMITVIESQEKMLEELQVANEEIVSASEEYQTLNEELETSKEEIEATNEELQTTNQELQVRNEQLAESYNYAEAIAETMHEPMLVLDKHIRIKSANKAFFKKFRVVKEGTEGLLLYELGNHQWDNLRLRKLLETIVKKDTHLDSYEITHVFPLIGKKTMLLNARRIVQKTLNEQLILLTFTDTTDVSKKRKAEKKGLEDIIDERTIALEKSYKALGEKNAFLEKMNKELEVLAYISSHDLQEPMRKIRNFTACLVAEEEKNLSQTGKVYLERMQDTVKRMQLLIEDLLKYLRVKKDNQNDDISDLDLIIEEEIESFKEVLADKKGLITVSGECGAKISGFQFRQFIHNLISNSLKFSHTKRFPRITIKSEYIAGRLIKRKGLSAKTRYCHITFTDNGIGFDPQFRERIFEVFQRLHEKEEYQGTGIGLAICKKIIENHKGVITATGKLDKGAQFDIYLPAL
jgi:two-component system CheB/CheR fusion protein